MSHIIHVYDIDFQRRKIISTLLFMTARAALPTERVFSPTAKSCPSECENFSFLPYAHDSALRKKA